MRRDKPSATASLVLKVLLFAAHDPVYGQVVSVDAARWSRSIAGKVIRFPRLFLFAVRNKAVRWLLKRVEATFNPGFILHVAARKALIDALGRASIESGTSQLIVLGSGYDTFALRMAITHPSIQCFEIDHPNTQRVKRAVLDATEVPANFIFVPADLSARSITEVLGSYPQFDPQLKTLIVIEGVLMYLSAAAVQNLFTEIAVLFKNGLTCIFTFMDRRADGDIQFKTAHPLVNGWLRRKHEQFLWGIERHRIAAYLTPIGYARTAHYGAADLASLFSNSARKPTLAEGELVGVTSK